VAYHFGVYATKPWLSGAIYWALEEFRVRPNWNGENPHPDPPIHQKGLIAFDGTKKPAYFVAQQIFRATQQLGRPRRYRAPRYHSAPPMASKTDTTRLEITARDAASSRSTRRLRREGRVPGILYGRGRDPLAFSVDARELRHALQGSGAVIELALGSESTPAV